MVADNPTLEIPPPPGFVKPTKGRAWSDEKDHVVVRIGQDEHGCDTRSAVELLRDLEQAIRDSI